MTCACKGVKDIMKRNMIPVIDIFAGPGGLGEGFSSYTKDNWQQFSIGLSIEMDAYAHSTLLLRSFYRQFPDGVPDDYYEYVSGKIERDTLFNRYPAETENARHEALMAELGGKEIAPEEIDQRISNVLGKSGKWVLIGGPPCQAYSVVGRARRTNDQNFFNDPKHYLYREYLRILAKHSPPVFVMENVKGILSSKEESGEKIFTKILTDLQQPNKSIGNGNGKNWGYRTYSLVPGKSLLTEAAPDDFVVRCEDYGIPQARHRVIILGIREDINDIPEKLVQSSKVPISKVLAGIPKIRSELSKRESTGLDWAQWLRNIKESSWFAELDNYSGIKGEIREQLRRISPENGTGSNHFRKKSRSQYEPEWYTDPKLHVTLNHESRTHMASDLHRYFFCACFARKYGYSPKLTDFPPSLLPDHKNVKLALKNSLFVDRFRVQVADRPGTTVTSHISKDGHYFIHPDPAQCRSLTVREAARIQTFPDNYFFEGPRTKQFQQVGNAVPPLLASQIAEIVYNVLKD